MSEAIRVGVMGLGEAGALIAEGLREARAQVTGFDPAVSEHPTITVVESVEAVVDGALVVLSLNSSTASVKVASQVAPLLAPGAG